MNITQMFKIKGPDSSYDKLIDEKIVNKPFTYYFDGNQVTLTWVKNTKDTGYVTSTDMFTDFAVYEHTKLLVQDIANELKIALTIELTAPLKGVPQALPVLFNL